VEAQKLSLNKYIFYMLSSNTIFEATQPHLVVLYNKFVADPIGNPKRVNGLNSLLKQSKVLTIC